MSGIDKKEYLKRYLSGGEAEEKKKKKRRKKRPDNAPAVKLPRSVLVDDDVDVRSLALSGADNEKSALLEEPDEAPLVAAFVDERPEEEVELEQYRSSNKWKTLGDDDDQTSWSHPDADPSPVRRRARHDSSSDASPPRRRQRHDSDSDLSPQRTAPDNPQRRRRHDSDSDNSPVRKDGDRNRVAKSRSKARHDSDSDLSPQRTNTSRPKGRHDSDSDMSPPRKRTERTNGRGDRGRGRRRHDSDSDLSPPRGNQTHSDDEGSRARRTKPGRHDSNSEDLSPPRPAKVSAHRGKPRSGKSRHDSDSDLSPTRRPKPDSRQRTRHDSDSDLSPARREGSKSRSGRKGGADSDLSPRRKQGAKQRGKSKRMDSDSDLSPDRGKASKTSEGARKPSKTMSGARAGLSDASALRRENEATRRKTDAAYSNLADDVSGRHAETVFRDKSGKRRDLKSEKRQKKEEEMKQAEEDVKFMQWGKGLAQVKQQQDTVEDVMKEMAKPLARYKDDQDLDQMLKEQDRDGDPMLAFLKKKDSRALAKAGIQEKPKYRGPKPAPNRFKIQPGYRWDGVDRSNGFEKKYFQRISDKKATSEIAYKWSIEDM